jgi:hypothetical protein
MIRAAVVPAIENDFWWKVQWSSTQRECLLRIRNVLGKAKVNDNALRKEQVKIEHHVQFALSIKASDVPVSFSRPKKSNEVGREVDNTDSLKELRFETYPSRLPLRSPALDHGK